MESLLQWPSTLGHHPFRAELTWVVAQMLRADNREEPQTAEGIPAWNRAAAACMGSSIRTEEAEAVVASCMGTAGSKRKLLLAAAGTDCSPNAGTWAVDDHHCFSAGCLAEHHSALMLASHGQCSIAVRNWTWIHLVHWKLHWRLFLLVGQPGQLQPWLDDASLAARASPSVLPLPTQLHHQLQST